MAMAKRRLITEAVDALRRVDYRDQPTCYIQEANRGKSYQPSGTTKHKMIGLSNVSSTIEVLSKKYDMQRIAYDETRPLDNTPAAYFLKLYPKQKKSPTRYEEKMTWGCKQVDDYRPTWAFYKLVVDQARKLHGEAIKPITHPWLITDSSTQEV